MKNIILIVSLLLMGVSSRADILNSSDNKNVADKFDPMLKAALFQMKIIADTSSILLSDIDYVEDLELKTSLWIDNEVNRAKTTRHEITSLKGLEYFSSLRRLKLVGNRTDTLECIIGRRDAYRQWNHSYEHCIEECRSTFTTGQQSD